MVNPILEHLKRLAEAGLHPHRARIQFHPEGAVLEILFGDWVDIREGTAPLPLIPKNIQTAGWERYPDDWSRLPVASWEEVEKWVQEAAWHSKAYDWVRFFYDAVLKEHELSGLYGPFFELGVEMQPRHLSWRFLPNLWLHPSLPGPRRRLQAKARVEQVPEHSPQQPKPNERFIMTLGD